MDILGLPLHPLIVHAAVVLIPLAALGALVLVVLPRLRRHYAWLTVALAAAAAVAALAARFTGPILADQLGLSGSARVAAHEAWGLWAPWPVVVLAIVLPVYLRLPARSGPSRTGGTSGPSRAGGTGGAGGMWRAVAATLTVASALAALVLVLLTGHSGATAVWGG